MGVVASITYMILIVLIIPFVFFKYLVSYSSLSNDDDMLLNYKNQYKDYENKQLFPHNKLAEFLSAALCLLSTIILGFFDDLFDIRWRHKFFLPAVASLPLLIVYYVDFSVTSIVVPGFLMRNGVGEFLVIVLNQLSQKANGLLTMLTGLKFTTLAIDYKIESTAPRLLDLGIFYYAYIFNASENVMHPSFAKFEGSRIGTALLEFLAIFKLLEVRRNDKGKIEEFTNLTIINLTLVWLGPLKESTLCIIILAFQFGLGIFMLLLRHTLGPWVFGYDNLSWGVK
ncbi:uncharacterized protein CXQ87_001268 [Candidozyma duobushaemuli]|uniref:UDP-N-acetylglucosamine--dolichyl-phosphate N-acetylglucosaminephosphotransferase n=1 Tax=Candidozyma duobushaemuli TaxID=1231522 RepID=A0A2V1AKZ8_9ASCO|nr:uncharacterized protein CXQ87_001268 [[Candida] duobushaemulonis]PVH18344.1 hypothetical protein CXQ87_001268 [[Candida] duobushaemulonis]